MPVAFWICSLELLAKTLSLWNGLRKRAVGSPVRSCAFEDEYSCSCRASLPSFETTDFVLLSSISLLLDLRLVEDLIERLGAVDETLSEFFSFCLFEMVGCSSELDSSILAMLEEALFSFAFD